MDLGLHDRSAVVLASTSGLGLAAAESLLREGARVSISGRDPERLAAAVEQLSEHGPRLFAEELDVTDGPALERHLQCARERHGSVEILVTNSGGPPAAGALEVNDSGIDAAVDLTLRFVVRAVNAVLPGMRERGWGRILGLTSISVRQPIPTLVYSNMLRSALTAYLKSLAGEVARDGVLVNSLCTGLFATERLEGLFAYRAEKGGHTIEQERARAAEEIPVGRIGDPREFGDFVAMVVSERASYLNGVALAYDGGANSALL